MDSIDVLNQVRPSVYRTAMKIQTVQKHCYMHVVPLRQLLPALRCLDDVEKQEVTREEVTRVLSRMFLNVSKEVPGQVTPQAAELTCQLIYQIYPQSVIHAVRCHACKTFPITGLRSVYWEYWFQSCFLTDRPTKRHKTTHLVLEYCTQPSWRESLALFAHNARHNLLPRRYSRLKSRGSLLGAWAPLWRTDRIGFCRDGTGFSSVW
ncbi:unnamed protein product [Boreogadus saida]